MLVKTNSCAMLALWLAIIGMSLALGTQLSHNDVLPKGELKEGGVQNNLFRRYVAASKDFNVEKSDLEDAGEPLFLTPLLNSGKIKVCTITLLMMLLKKNLI